MMRRYAAFLRGINISGKNRVSMPVLKQVMEQAGYKEVVTYLNSGNILFQTEEDDPSDTIADLIQARFDLDIPVHVISVSRLQDILEHAPHWWGMDDRCLYDNLIFILTDESAEDISQEIGETSDGLERVACFEDVIFWSFDRNKYQKCNWWKKTAQSGIGEKLTIRTAATLRKLLGKVQ